MDGTVSAKRRMYQDMLSALTDKQHRVPIQPSLTTYKDAELVMDMIRRGYAVMKLPEGGGPPDVLRKGGN